MDLNKKIIDKINNLINQSSNFDSGFKIIFNLDTDTLNEQNAEILYSMTKNYLLLRKEHGEIILMFNKLCNSISYDDILVETPKLQKKTKKNKENDNLKLLYDISTFNTLLNNVNDLINNIDYQYKKIAIKYPKFINKKPIIIILITPPNSNNKYINIINELKKIHTEHKYITIELSNDNDKNILKFEELKYYGIKYTKDVPKIYIINGTTISDISLTHNQNLEQIKDLLE